MTDDSGSPREAPRAGVFGELPIPLDPIVGRHAELARLGELRRTARLITLRGPAGTGKSRLAREVAAARPGGARWVDVGRLTGPARLRPAVGPIGGEPILLVLDNCEHLVDACARAVPELLGRYPRLTVLVTSREALDVPGEAVVMVGPLPLPDGAQADPARLLRSPAVRLFVRRAGIPLDDGNARDVAAICTRLDGNPLAVELAARRARDLSVADVRARLDDPFALLTGDLRVAVATSYEPLGAAERDALRRLSILDGTFGLDVAAAVCAGADVVDLLTVLEARSVLVAGPAAGRFRLPGPVRWYAYQRLSDVDGVDPARRRLVDWLVSRAVPFADRPLATVDVFGLLDAERDTLHAAVPWAGPDERVLLAAVLARCWRERGRYAAARELLREVRPGASEYRSTALAVAAQLAIECGDPAAGGALAREAVALDRAAGRPLPLTRALATLSGAYLAAGDGAAAREYARQALDAVRADGRPLEVAACGHAVAAGALAAGDLDGAGALLAGCLPVLRTADEPWLRVGVLHTAGVLAAELGDLAAAGEYLREGVRVPTSHPAGRITAVEGLTVVAARQGNALRAVRLGAAATALRRVWGIAAAPARVDAAVRDAARGLTAPVHRQAAAAGRALTAEQLLGYALTDRWDDGGEPLTDRELAVARLVAQGLSNRELAGRLGIAERTVQAHLDRVRAKLGLRSRTQVASWAARRGG